MMVYAFIFPIVMQASGPPPSGASSGTGQTPPAAASSAASGAATASGSPPQAPASPSGGSPNPAVPAALSSPPPSAPAAGTVLRLDEAVRIALKRQPTVLQAQFNSEAAEGRADQSRSSMLPQISGLASYQRIHGRGITSAAGSGSSSSGTGTSGGGTPAGAAGGGGGVAPTGISSTEYNYFSIGASGSQVLWDFGQTYRRWEAAKETATSFHDTERTTQQQVLLNVRRVYFQARAQKALMLVAQETVQNQQLHVTQIEGFAKYGVRPEIDLLQARTDLANYQVQFITAQNNYAISKAQLNQAMGVVGTSDYEVADEGLGPLEGEDASNDDLVTRAFAARPELTALQQQAKAQQLTVKAIRGAYGPTLSGSAGVSETGTDPSALGLNWNAGVSLVWPFFQGGLTRGQVREAEANLSATAAQIEGEKLQVRVDVEQALLSVRGAKATIGAADEALKNARIRLRLADARYTQGVGSIIELGDAQLAVANAAAQSVQAQFNLSTARASLLAALGRP